MDNEKQRGQGLIQTWPVAPTFLVKCIISKYEKYSPNKHGVYPSDTVRGLLADASDDPDIQNPLSLFQVVPETCEFDKFSYIGSIVPAKDDDYLASILKDKKVIRIDPNYLYKKKTCCDIFRACNGCEGKCHEQDCRIVLLYHKDLAGIDYTSDFKEFYSKLVQIIEEYNREYAVDSPLHCECDENSNRLYVWYKCPYSNFYEYFFPVVHAGKVIAVLMQGQRIPENLDRESIFQSTLRNPDISQEMKNKLTLSINAIPEEDFGKVPMDKSRLNAIWNRISTLEERIDKEVLAFSRAYIDNKFYRIGKVFHRQIDEKIKQQGELTDEAYQEILNGALRKICYVFNKKGFIRIYSTEYKFEEKNSNNDTFFLIGTSNELTDIERDSWAKITFQNLPSSSEVIKDMNGVDFLPYLKNKINFNEGSIFRIESLSIGNTKHLIWKEYSNKSFIHQKQFNDFSNFLKTFYNTLWEPYNLLRSEKLRKNLEASMRVSVHETAQIIPVIVDTLMREYKLDSRLLIKEDRLSLPGITQRTNILHDTIHRLYLLDNLYRRSTLMFKELELNNDWHDLYRLIYSVRSLCDQKARGNNMQKIIVNGLKESGLSQHELYTDYQLISHLLFNLVDNAIKYGYMGSNININISLSEEDIQHSRNGDWNQINSLKISVISYGYEVSEADAKHLYDLFFRTKAFSHKQGMGIGLFLVKKICNSMGYKIEFKSSMLADYNIPILYRWKRQGNVSSIRSVSQPVIDEVVNMDEIPEKVWYVEEPEFEAAIVQPTFRNEFCITINKIDSNLVKPI